MARVDPSFGFTVPDVAFVQLWHVVAQRFPRRRSRADREQDRLVTQGRLVALGFVRPTGYAGLPAKPVPDPLGDSDVVEPGPQAASDSSTQSVPLEMFAGPPESGDQENVRNPGWLHTGLQQAHWRLTRPGIRAVFLVAIITAGVTAAVMWRDRPHEIAVAGFSANAPASSPAVAGPADNSAPPTEPAARSTTQLVVAVVGKVKHPGLVTLDQGARVADAIAAAGGLLPNADPGLLNLARRLADGEQVAVGISGGETAAAAGAETSPAQTDINAAQSPVNLNTATIEQLDQLPGVGPVTAQRIVEWRTAHGRFTSANQLRDVPGIGDAKLAQLSDRVAVG